MPYISLLNSWKNHDINRVDEMLDDHVVVYYLNELGIPQHLTKSMLLTLLKKRMQQVDSNENLQWNFEIVHRARFHGQNMVIFYTYSNEHANYNETNKTMITIIFDSDADNPHRIKMVYIAPNIKGMSE